MAKKAIQRPQEEQQQQSAPSGRVEEEDVPC
jgi:hypothetical protein